MRPLVTFDEIRTPQGYENLIKLCRLILRRHYNMYYQYYDELISNAIVQMYSALKEYDPNYSFINYAYTVIRNSYTKDVNKYKRVFVRENEEFRNEVSKDYNVITISVSRDFVIRYVKRFNLNVKHKSLLFHTLEENGIHIKGYKYCNEVLNINDMDTDYIGRIVGMILYEYYEKNEGVRW